MIRISQISQISLLCLCVFISACATSGSSGTFGSSQSNLEDVYFDYFRDIPIPTALTVDAERSLISVTQNGAKVGLLTLEGSLEQASLMNAMAHNMVKHDWVIAASIMGPKALQIYKKDGLFAVLYYYDQMTSSAMEIWICAEVSAGAYAPLVPAMPRGSSSRGAAPTALMGSQNTPSPTEDSPTYEELTYEGSTYPPLDDNTMDGSELAQ